MLCINYWQEINSNLKVSVCQTFLWMWCWCSQLVRRVKAFLNCFKQHYPGFADLVTRFFPEILILISLESWVKHIVDLKKVAPTEFGCLNPPLCALTWSAWQEGKRVGDTASIWMCLLRIPRQEQSKSLARCSVHLSLPLSSSPTL